MKSFNTIRLQTVVINKILNITYCLIAKLELKYEMHVQIQSKKPKLNEFQKIFKYLKINVFFKNHKKIQNF